MTDTQTQTNTNKQKQRMFSDLLFGDEDRCPLSLSSWFILCDMFLSDREREGKGERRGTHGWMSGGCGHLRPKLCSFLFSESCLLDSATEY